MLERVDSFTISSFPSVRRCDRVPLALALISTGFRDRVRVDRDADVPDGQVIRRGGAMSVGEVTPGFGQAIDGGGDGDGGVGVLSSRKMRRWP
jgi:hypothetical protein